MGPAQPRRFSSLHTHVLRIRILFRLALFGALLCPGFANPVPALMASNSTCYENDACTLLMFKSRLWNEGEPTLATWRSTNLSLWRGVTWREESNGMYSVEKLELGGLQLNGSDISPLLQDGLTSLVVLNISGNDFTTQLRSTWQICPPLQVLDISNNSFSGSLPRAFHCNSSRLDSAQLSLSVLNVSRNKFFGEVPESFFQSGQFPAKRTQPVGFVNLSSLVLEKNNFTGRIPQSLGSCSSLVDLKLAQNYFTGAIPFGELGRLKKLETLDVSNNSIYGRLEMPIENGSFSQLKTLLLGFNRLQGPIPEALGNLSSLENLELIYNNFTGSIPFTLGKLIKLQQLRLAWNNLDGTLPEGLSQLQSLRVFSCNHNRIFGPMRPLLNCSKLTALWMGENSFGSEHFSISRRLGNLTNLRGLSLLGNDMKGNIPAELGRLVSLRILNLGWNALSGVIPGELCSLFKLQVLFLEQNSLAGSTPGCFQNFSYIRHLDLSVNQLSGGLPSDIGYIASLTTVDTEDPDLIRGTYNQDLDDQSLLYGFSQAPVSLIVNHNNLSGELPSSLGDAGTVQRLILNNNLFSGEIPSSLGNMASLYQLDLSSNRFEGQIPLELTKLTFLSHLNLSFNDLEGPIPEGHQFDTFVNSSFWGNPGLCGTILNISCGKSITPSSSPAGKSDFTDHDDLVVFLSALTVGFACGFLLTGATLIFCDRARHLLYRIIRLPHSVGNYDRQYGSFDQR